MVLRRAALVTPHPLNALNPTTRILSADIDTLVLGFHGAVKPKLQGSLQESLHASVPIKIANFTFTVSNSDHSNYAYVLNSAQLRLEIARSEAIMAFLHVMVTLRAHFLACRGRDEAYLAACEVVTALFDSKGIQKEVVSRCDLYADVQYRKGFNAEDGDRFVTCARDRRTHDKDEDFTGFTFGKGPILARVYDKTKEIAHSRKHWVYDQWGIHPGERVSVWRVEYQLRRKYLRSNHIYTFNDLLRASRQLWEYLTTKWLTLRVSRGKQRTRWPISRFWKWVQGAVEFFTYRVEPVGAVAVLDLVAFEKRLVDSSLPQAQLKLMVEREKSRFKISQELSRLLTEQALEAQEMEERALHLMPRAHSR